MGIGLNSLYIYIILAQECQGIPSPDNGESSCSNGAYGIGSTCMLICSNTHALSGNSEVECTLENGSGVWNGVLGECIFCKL